MERPSLRKRQLEKEMGETLYTEAEVAEIMESERTYQAERYAALEQRYKELEEKHRVLNPPKPKRTEQTEHPIFAAIGANDIEAVRAILREEPYAIDHVQPTTDYLPLHLAAEIGDREMVQILLDAGHHPYAPSKIGSGLRTPVDIAALSGRPAIAQLLLDQKKGSYFIYELFEPVLEAMATTDRVSDYIETFKVLTRYYYTYPIMTALKYGNRKKIREIAHEMTFEDPRTRAFAKSGRAGKRYQEAYVYAFDLFEELTGETAHGVNMEGLYERHPENRPKEDAAPPKQRKK